MSLFSSYSQVGRSGGEGITRIGICGAHLIKPGMGKGARLVGKEVVDMMARATWDR